MTGYTRQSAAQIIPGEDIEAGPLAAEFNAIQAAFDGTTGHGHSGNPGDGPKLSLANSVSGYLPAANGGTGGRNNTTALTNPTVTDDSSKGYATGSSWINIASGTYYTCVSNQVGAAVWNLNQAASGSFLQIGNNLSDVPNKATARTNLGVAPGTDVQAFSTALQTLSSPGTVDRIPVSDGNGSYSYAPVTTFSKGLLDDANQAAAKTTLGLGNVDNTSDANKPVSTATQTALDQKAPTASPALTGTPTAPTASAGTNTTQVATTAFAQTAIQNSNQTGYAVSYIIARYFGV